MRKPTKTEMLILAAFVYCGLMALITPVLIYYAYLERGCFEIGGEMIPVLTIPFVLLGTAVCYLSEL